MTSLQTCFRAVVMLATIGIVAKAWHLYGPSVAEMRAIGQRVYEVADELMSDSRQPEAVAGDAGNDPRLQQAPPFAAATPLPPGPAPQPILLATAESESPAFAQQAVGEAPIAAAPATPPTRLIPVAPEEAPALAPAGGDARLDAASARLAEIGAREGRLEPWGNEGRWYRFSCDAPWVDAPNYTRHFEAVAADPASAVEQVAAEIEAWHASRPAVNATR
jgi:hypothetical protein